MHWITKDLAEDGVKLVRFIDGRLFSILRDKNKNTPTYSLGDEFGLIEGNPQHEGPLTEGLLLTILNTEAAEPVSLGDAQRIRADYRVTVKQRAASA